MRRDIKIKQEYMPEAGRRVWEIYQHDGTEWRRLDVVQQKMGIRYINTPFPSITAAAEALKMLEAGEYIANNWISVR